MPVNPHSRRAGALLAIAATMQTAAFTFAAGASAEPTPSPGGTNDPCGLIAGPARDYCEDGEAPATPGRSSVDDPTAALDPLSSLARGCADAASWTIGKLSQAVESTATVDFTNLTFLAHYAIVFAAATILTLLLWLLAVAKRAIRGVPFMTAVSEAIGFLWLTVLASAFTPLILYTLVSVTDGVTEVISGSTSGQTEMFFGNFSKALAKGDDIGGGPIMLIVVSLVTILAAGVLYLELFIRAVLLYVGALLGVVVYAGLVDKNMWGHVRRWAGIMIAIILVKPVIVIVLGLAGALSADDGPDSFSAVVSGLAIILLAIFASAMIYRFVPGFGDEIAASRNNRIQNGAEGKAAAVISSPAALVSQGIKTHSSRGNQNTGGDSGSSTPRPANPASGGMAAHGSRTPPAGGAAPAPRNSPTGGTPHSNRNSTGGGRR
ncbi:hypothetical protein [Streptomyces sp. V1I6]|uniref:hypothetical protein n=1 Tax=Streptomyces sp. V1I6 TaxID=3042273 RepID=UPI0027814DA7|nr:hypothetical protein [Streptomyces sp. V1I6]MDQ0843720.1 hypothetical protein [Streptomyces sp. V1I6]